MKTIINFINEKLKLNNQSVLSTLNPNIDIVYVEELTDLLKKPNKHVLANFLKGTEYKSSLNICFTNLHKYIHIHRYDDNHRLNFTIVCNNSIKWPNKEEWENNSIEYDELDDRNSMRSLVNSFYNFLEKTIK